MRKTTALTQELNAQSGRWSVERFVARSTHWERPWKVSKFKRRQQNEILKPGHSSNRILQQRINDFSGLKSEKEVKKLLILLSLDFARTYERF